eukprot:scaffold19764_cov114-Isochrysis_galbana.AAC.2
MMRPPPGVRRLGCSTLESAPVPAAGPALAVGIVSSAAAEGRAGRPGKAHRPATPALSPFAAASNASVPPQESTLAVPSATSLGPNLPTPSPPRCPPSSSSFSRSIVCTSADAASHRTPPVQYRTTSRPRSMLSRGASQPGSSEN